MDGFDFGTISYALDCHQSLRRGGEGASGPRPLPGSGLNVERLKNVKDVFAGYVMSIHRDPFGSAKTTFSQSTLESSNNPSLQEINQGPPVIKSLCTSFLFEKMEL